MLELVRYRRWWYAFSALIIVPGLISLSLYGLNLGIDFTGGSLMELNVPSGTQGQQVKDAIGHQYDPIVQSTSNNSYQVRLKELTPAQHTQVLDQVKQQIGPSVTEERFETVGPTISEDLTRKAILSVILGSLLIVAYIAYAFRNVPKPASSWRFGVTTILTLVHDLIFTLGVFSLLGHFFGVEVDANFVAALLTVIGFSVHDTIVVFDRIRENLIRGQGKTFEDTVNFSIVQTIVRSINTSLTVLLVLAAMYLFGGSSIQTFVLALLVGIAAGTYSSIFNAAPILVTWQNWADKRAAKKAKA
ncbi:protein translocase subunit SecF [Patescibacteria group bacterium]|nr:protein translocase subunit SecF [Patescibacteria group bacterium]